MMSHSKSRSTEGRDARMDPYTRMILGFEKT